MTVLTKEFTKIFLKLWDKNGKVKRYVSEKKMRILAYVVRGNYKKAYIRVNYGYGINVFGERVLFHNDGTYYNRSDLQWALNAFTEKD